MLFHLAQGAEKILEDRLVKAAEVRRTAGDSTRRQMLLRTGHRLPLLPYCRCHMAAFTIRETPCFAPAGEQDAGQGRAQHDEGDGPL